MKRKCTYLSNLLRTTICCLLVFICNSQYAYSQSIPAQAPNKIVDGKKEGEWVVWFDKDWLETDKIEHVNSYRIINYFMGESIGKSYEYYSNGNLMWEGQLCKVFDAYYEFDGLNILYDINGNKISEYYYSHGLKNGNFIEYYENGNIAFSGSYFYGLEDGEWKKFTSSGDLEFFYTKDISVKQLDSLLIICINSGNKYGTYEIFKKFLVHKNINSNQYLLYQFSLAEIYNNDGLLEHSLSIFRKFVKKINAFNIISDSSLIAKIYNQYSIAETNTGNDSTAEFYYKKNIKLFQSSNNSELCHELSISYNNLGLIYSNRGEIDLAEFCFSNAINQLKNNKELIPYEILINLSELYIKKGEIDKAVLHLISIMLGSYKIQKDTKLKARYKLAQLYFQEGQLKDAYKEYKVCRQEVSRI